MLYLKANQQVGIEEYCDRFLCMQRASPFGVLTTMYYEIRRCVVHDKRYHYPNDTSTHTLTTARRLLIHRCDPDPGFEPGSAVLVDTGKEMVKVTWGMMRTIIHQTLQNVSELLDSIELPGKVKVCYAKHGFFTVSL